jgi:hypothetical protein
MGKANGGADNWRCVHQCRLESTEMMPPRWHESDPLWSPAGQTPCELALWVESFSVIAVVTPLSVPLVAAPLLCAGPALRWPRSALAPLCAGPALPPTDTSSQTALITAIPDDLHI